MELFNDFVNQDKSACGVGFVASKHGIYDHEILKKALFALKCEEHRGACAADQITADGAGVMTDIPFEMIGHKRGTVAVASLFMPSNDEQAYISLKTFEQTFEFMGMEIIEYREVPIDKSVLGEQALKLLPKMIHAIIKRPKHCRTDYSFDKLLYQAKMYNRMNQKNKLVVNDFFFNSLSANTIVYKGLVRAQDLDRFYLDLQNPEFKTRFGLFHRRFSTNTVSTWDKAQPFRVIAHNGEINTIQGNRSWAFSRERALGLREDELLNHYKVSDSGSLNEMVEALAFRSSIKYIEDILAIMMPPADKKDDKFYKFWSRAMEPWDGPALITFSTGTKVGARLDRNGFRPCRWALTEDYFYLSSEAGSFELNEEEILQKGTLNAGTGVVMDVATGEISFKDPSESIENSDASYDARLMPLKEKNLGHSGKHLINKYLFSYTEEDFSRILIPMMTNGKEPIGSMGDTARLLILSDEPRSFFDYFYQAFAQVTNPPLDYIREKTVTNLNTFLGIRPNIFAQKELIPPPPAIDLKSPILNLGQMEYVRSFTNPETSGHKLIATELDMTFKRAHGSVGFQRALDQIGEKAVEAVNKKSSILILTDRNADKENLPIPSLLGLRAVILGLSRAGLRLETSLVVDSGEIKTTHHIACLISFGAAAVCPYLALEVARFEEGHKVSKVELEADEKEKNMIKAYEEGLLKIMSKMGISVVRSYHSSKLFTIIGLNKTVTERYFARTHTELGGLTIEGITEEIIHKADLAHKAEESKHVINNFLFREDTITDKGERHAMTVARSKIIHQLARDKNLALNNIELYNEYLKLGKVYGAIHVRDLFTFKEVKENLPLENVESKEEIMKRFGSGAMSFGAISAESQRDIILAMKEVGGRSNSGEGGENPYYFTEGISATTKQVASARFGVTALYLAAGNELQIKVAQGAKPGEGGQLMSAKVNADIARARFSNPNVDLISPPPLHDIYSIEDLKQLIYELKQICPEAKVNVKLVAGMNIGTIAVGVAKAGADVIDVVGGDGGTGAASLTSMKHAGLPWEFGLIEVHKFLIQNGLRTKVKLRTDGGLHSGEDIVIAAMMGAEEYNFGKLLLVAEGCIMARICEKNTCPAGITTHDPVFKAKYKGHKDHVVKTLQYLAEDVRRHLAKLGLKSLQEAIGRMDLLTIDAHAKDLIFKRNLDLSFVLNAGNLNKYQSEENPFYEGISPLNQRIVEETKTTLEANDYAEFAYPIYATDRATLATLAGEIARKENKYRQEFYDNKALYPYTKEIKITFTGSAGQGFGVFMTDGMDIKLYGEANDSVAKSMSGGKMVITPAKNVKFKPAENVIIGNCALYGATAGVLYVHGIAGDRFAVRNSGAYAVVEGTGLHACEYMTNGKVIILGEYQNNVGSGMTGGELYLYRPTNRDFINKDYIAESEITTENWDELHTLLEDYLIDTGSKTVEQIFSNWERYRADFVKFVPIHTLKKKEKKQVVVESLS